MIPVVAISLRRSVARRATMRKLLTRLDIPYEFHDAIDGNELSEDDANRLCPGRRNLTHRFIISRQEIACLESHKACLEAIIASRLAFACVLEDDATLPDDFAAFLDHEWLRSLGDFDVLKLGGDGGKRQEERVVVVANRLGRRVCAPVHPTYSTIGYIVTHAGARKLLEHVRHGGDQVDVSLFRRPAANAKILDVRPFPVVPAPLPSTIIHEPGFKDEGPLPRQIASWLPHRLSLLEVRPRRYFVFLRAQGIRGLQRLERVPLR